MSLTWIAFYMGDYLKKTQRLTTEQHGAYLLLLIECWQMGHIPADEAGRAQVARVPLPRWKKIGPAVSAFFNADGTNKRASEEIEKAAVVSLRRSMAGTKGGLNSGIRRAIAKGEAIKREAQTKQSFKQTGSTARSPTQAREPSNCEATNNSKITISESLAARERERSAGSLATALDDGALARPPEAEQAKEKRPFEGKLPNQMTKQELDDYYAAKRAREAKPEPKPEPPKEPVKRDVGFLETPF